jgi:hypothetical protein
MRQSSPVFYAAKQQGISVDQPSRARIEDAIDRIWPTFSTENGIRGMTHKQRINRGYLSILLVNAEVFR